VFFPYYGGKYIRAKYYTRPRHRVVVEPFAGSAGYATRYRHHAVRLYDVNPVVIGVWNYLIRVRGAELRSLPAEVEHLDDHPGLIPEARWLIGFWLNKGCTTPRKRRSAWMPLHPSDGCYWGERVRDRLAEQVESIRHWTAEVRSYDRVPDGPATWFVDPPYRGRVGSYYAHKFHDHGRLAEWCRSRTGQVIVCEHHGADWLPFRPLGPTGRRNYREAIWTAG
jgi:hypothetical protein